MQKRADKEAVHALVCLRAHKWISLCCPSQKMGGQVFTVMSTDLRKQTGERADAHLAEM